MGIHVVIQGKYDLEMALMKLRRRQRLGIEVLSMVKGK